MVQSLGANGISTLTECLYFKKVGHKKESMLFFCCVFLFFSLLSQNVRKSLHIMEKKVKGCVCFENDSTTKAMKGFGMKGFGIFQEPTVLFFKAAVRHKALKAQGVFGLLVYSLEQNRNLLD